jgi:hypothetical protein
MCIGKPVAAENIVPWMMAVTRLAIHGPRSSVAVMIGLKFREFKGKREREKERSFNLRRK